MILPAGGRKSPAEAGREFCEQHVQRGLPLQTDNFARGRSFQTAKGPERSFGRLRGLASPSDLCGSGGNTAEWATSSGGA